MSENIASIIAAVGSVIAAIASTIGLYLKFKAEKTYFTITRGRPIAGTNESFITISNPTKPLGKCQVFYNGIALTANVVPEQQWFYIPINGDGIFRLLQNTFDEDGEITVKNGWRTLLKTKVKDIHY